MSFLAAAALVIWVQPSVAIQGEAAPTAGALTASQSAPAVTPNPGTEAALRGLVAGLASGSPDYAKLSPMFADVVRNDLPMTQPMFKELGELKSITFRERGRVGDDVYLLTFANGQVMMSARLDEQGRMLGGMLRPMGKTAGR